MKQGKVLIEKIGKLWYVRVIAGNGKILMISEGLSSKRNAITNYSAAVEAFEFPVKIK
jgi:hypothetical protein